MPRTFGNVLRGGAVKAALGEDAGGRIDDLRRAAALAGAAPGRGQRENVHPIARSWPALGDREPVFGMPSPVEAIVFCHGGDLNSIY